jgi:predicted NUDIX family NTP pyrophosphohydrolase
MVTDSELARRLAVLEQEVADLKRRVETSSGNWPERVFGRMKDFPEFDEVTRMARELRDAQLDPED